VSPPIVIVKTGTAEARVREEHGDFEHWITRGLGASTAGNLVVDVSMRGVLPPHAEVGGIVVTGSPSMVSQPEPWTQPTADWLREATLSGKPVLGICYGHQLLAAALGGRVGPNPNGREIGTVRVALDRKSTADDALLGHLPDELVVHATHVESVLELPDGAAWLGASELEANHAFSYGPSAWGVQFHPEFDADVMRGYLAQRAGVLRDEGFDPDRMISSVEHSEHGTSLLRRFRQIVDDPPR
jgi:GMP synthase (glutamine-hydrolysing)